MPSSKHFNFDYITSRPDRNKEEIPLWCDYLEIVCIMTKGSVISRGEVIDLVFKEGKEFAVAQDEYEEEEEEYIAVDEFEERSESHEEAFSGTLEEQRAVMGSDKGIKSDNRARIVDDWFAHLLTRSRSFYDLYPFTVDEHMYTLSLKAKLSPQQKLYLYFLLAGNLRVLSKKAENKITTDFEFICYDAQKLMFPLSLKNVSGLTHFFGKNPEAEGIFTGDQSEKIQKLASMINSYKVDVSGIRPPNTGDRGMDIVSFISFKDDIAPGIPLILAQCACSYSQWKKKQFDHAPARYKYLYIFDVDYIRLMFIPFFYRDQNGKWFSQLEIDTVVIDRLRLMKLLYDQKPSTFSRALAWAELILTRNEEDRETIADYILEGTAC